MNKGKIRAIHVIALLVSAIALASVASAAELTLSLSPSSPRTNEDITCTITNAPFGTEDGVTYTFEWRKNGALQASLGQSGSSKQSTVSKSLTSNGDSWSCTASADNGTETAGPETRTVSVSNTAPVAPTLSFSPDPATSADIISCSASATDPDGDDLNYEFVWLVDGTQAYTQTVEYPGTTSFLPNTPSAGAELTCRARASDGTQYSPYSSRTLTVRSVVNTRPADPTVIINDGSSTSVDTSPLNAIVSGYVMIEDVPVDADGDPLSFQYRWYKNAVLQSQTGPSISSSQLSEGDTWSVEVRASDGIDYSGWSSSQTVTIYQNYTIVEPPDPETPYQIPSGFTRVTHHTRMVQETYDVTCYWNKVGTVYRCTDDSGALCTSCCAIISGADRYCSSCGGAGSYYGDLIQDSCTGAYDCSNRQGGSYTITNTRWDEESYTLCHYIKDVLSWTSCSSHMTLASSVRWASVENRNYGQAPCIDAELVKSCNIPPHQPRVAISPHRVEGSLIYAPDSEDDLTCSVTGPADTYRSGYSSNPQWATQNHIMAVSWAAASGSDSLRSYYSGLNTWPDPDQPWNAAAGQSLDAVTYNFRWYKNGAHQPQYDTSRSGIRTPLAALSARSLVPKSATRPGDVWKCEVIGKDNYHTGLESLPGVYEVTIGLPDLGVCDGTDSDGDGKIDEGMYSCWNDEGFMVGDNIYCFDCSQRAQTFEDSPYISEYVPSGASLPIELPTGRYSEDGYIAALADNEGTSHLMHVMNRYRTDYETRGYSVMQLHGNAGGTGLAFADYCKPFTAAHGTTQPGIYVDSQGSGSIICNDPRMILDATAGGNAGKITDSQANTPYVYGRIFEFTEICDGRDNDGDSQIDQGYYSCQSGESFLVGGDKEACFVCEPRSWNEARDNPPDGYEFASILSLTPGEIGTIISAYLDAVLIYNMNPQGLFIRDGCSQVWSQFLGANTRNINLFGFDAQAPDGRDGWLVCNDEPRMAFTGWTENTENTLSGARLEDAPNEPYYGAVYIKGGIGCGGNGGGGNGGGNGGDPCPYPCPPGEGTCGLDDGECKCILGGPDECPPGTCPFTGCPPGQICDPYPICECIDDTNPDNFTLACGIAFTDEQADLPVTLTSTASGPWEIENISEDGCVSPYPNFQPNLPLTTSLIGVVTTAYLKAPAGGVCTTEVMATDLVSHDTSIAECVVDARPISQLCPNCNVTELPAIIHPLTLYSGNPTDAQRAVASATLAVSSLQGECPCASNVEAMLSNARVHLTAARTFLTGCSAGSSSECRLAQYYAGRASEIAASARSLI
jgi:hypothetical protein